MGLLTKIFTIAMLGSMFLIISVSLFSDLDSTYQSNKSSNFNSFYGSLNKTAYIVSDSSQSYSRNMTDKLFNTSTNTIDTPDESLKAGSFAALRVIFQLPNLLSNILYGISVYLFIPPWLIGMVISIVIVFIAAMLIQLFFNRRT